MGTALKQIWNGSIVTSDDRERHKLRASDFVAMLRECSNVTAQEPEPLSSGLSLIRVSTGLPSSSFNILYQDLRSGDHDGDDRKRIQVSSAALEQNVQYFYVAGYKAGDKTVLVAYLTGTRQINSSASISSRWIEWEPFYDTYKNGVSLWSKKGISYLGVTADNLGLMITALATRSLDGCTVNVSPATPARFRQAIYYGTPGGGKSHRAKEATAGMAVYRVTFHPDTDYASFVGAYRPVPRQEGGISYEFVPQTFLNAYVNAWERLLEGNEQPVCLLVEELNRGNCAQIFGDLFQLLDRGGNGYSEYSIIASAEMARYLKDRLGPRFEQYYGRIRENSDLLAGGAATIPAWSGCGDDVRLCLPPNMSIICTMNTSDQSLFPMDSAFKRRWDWEYVPVDYANSDSRFVIAIDDTHKYSWPGFLKRINAIIYDVTRSEDKQMGNFFVKGDENSEIGCSQFVSKVMFYLWSEICKDNPKARKRIFSYALMDGTSVEEHDGLPSEQFAFSCLSGDNRDVILRGFMKFHGVGRLPVADDCGPGDEDDGEDPGTDYRPQLSALLEYARGRQDFLDAFTLPRNPHNNEIWIPGVNGLEGQAMKIAKNNRGWYLGWHDDTPGHALFKNMASEKREEISARFNIPSQMIAGRHVSGWKENYMKIQTDRQGANEEDFAWIVDKALELYGYFSNWKP